MPVKPLSFKGDKKVKKRKHRDRDDSGVSSERTTTSTTKPEKHNEEDVGEDDDDDSWTTPDAPSDLSGPVILVLPTTPVTCLASDAHGNVFASVVENIVEGHVETAEPHDVRQVWVASQVAGATTGQMSFKASHGGYLSCDVMGVLGARREARGVEEGFEVEEIGGDEDSSSSSRRVRWRLKTSASGSSSSSNNNNNSNTTTTNNTTVKGEDANSSKSRYLAALVAKKEKIKREDDDDDDNDDKKTRKSVAITLRGDGEAGEPTTELVIKMQARFKPRVQQSKAASKAHEKVSRREMEQAVGRRLEDDEVKRLKRARKNGTYHEELLDVRVKGKHDKFA